MSPERATVTAGTAHRTVFEQRVVEVAIECIDGPARSPQVDLLAAEEPLEIRLGHGTANARKRHSLTLTMRTPGNDLELAVGFLFAEGVVPGAEDIQRAESCGPPAGPLRMQYRAGGAAAEGERRTISEVNDHGRDASIFFGGPDHSTEGTDQPGDPLRSG
jgi:hypothetical protein